MRRAHEFCLCGCGQSLEGKHSQAMYINDAHGKRAYRRAGRVAPRKQRRAA